MALFAHRKAPSNVPARDQLGALHAALRALETEPDQTTRIVDLKRILRTRIEELEAAQHIINS